MQNISKTALITGADGIGRATALALARKVLILDWLDAR